MRARDASLAASASGLAALVLLPKCPLCFAALFVWAGASGTFAYDVAPLVKPFVIASSILLGALLVVARRREPCCAAARRRRLARSSITSSRTAP